MNSSLCLPLCLPFLRLLFASVGNEFCASTKHTLVDVSELRCRVSLASDRCFWMRPSLLATVWPMVLSRSFFPLCLESDSGWRSHGFFSEIEKLARDQRFFVVLVFLAFVHLSCLMRATSCRLSCIIENLSLKAMNIDRAIPTGERFFFHSFVLQPRPKAVSIPNHTAIAVSIPSLPNNKLGDTQPICWPVAVARTHSLRVDSLRKNNTGASSRISQNPLFPQIHFLCI